MLLRMTALALAQIGYVVSIGQSSAGCTGGPSGNNTPIVRQDFLSGTPSTVQVQDGSDLRTLSYVRVGKRAIFEGDIILGDADQIAFAAQAGPLKALPVPADVAPLGASPQEGGPILIDYGYVAKSVLAGPRRWPNNVIPYVIDSSLDAAQSIRDAMHSWMDVTKLRFVERDPANPAHKNYVVFTTGKDPNACLSEGVGMKGGRQAVEIVPGCGYGQIVHEIGHVIGLDHEQNRSDRDKYVKVILPNIEQGYAGQFSQRPSLYRDAGGYDFDFIMHYEPHAFSCNGEATITPLSELPAGILLGQRTHISDGDAEVINQIYKSR